MSSWVKVPLRPTALTPSLSVRWVGETANVQSLSMPVSPALAVAASLLVVFVAVVLSGSLLQGFGVLRAVHFSLHDALPILMAAPGLSATEKLKLSLLLLPSWV